VVLEIIEPVPSMNAMKNELRSLALGEYQILGVVDYDSIRSGLVVQNPTIRSIARVPR
jgi:hypothetical protein